MYRVCSGVNASSRLGGRTTEWGGVLEGSTPPHTGLRLSERRATNIGLLYPKVRNNIGGCVPGIPGGVDASGSMKLKVQDQEEDQRGPDCQARCKRRKMIKDVR